MADLISVTSIEIDSCSVTFFWNKSFSINFFDDTSLLVAFFGSLTGLSSSPHKARSRREGDETRLDFENKFPEFSRTFLSRPVDEVDLKNRFRNGQF